MKPQLVGLCDRNAVHGAHDFLHGPNLWRCVGQITKMLAVWDTDGHATTNIGFFNTT